MNVIDAFNAAQCKSEIPAFRVGDTVRVHQRISEGGRERIQVFEGVVIGRKGGSGTETFTVRRISFGVGVERIFPLHSPKIEQIEVVALGKVRRAKLYYLRDRVGKAARVKSKTVRKSEDEKKADRKEKKAKKAEVRAAKDEAKAAKAEEKAAKTAKRTKKATKKKAAKAASKAAK